MPAPTAGELVLAEVVWAHPVRVANLQKSTNGTENVGKEHGTAVHA
jgi:hypothetical protein